MHHDISSIARFLAFVLSLTLAPIAHATEERTAADELTGTVLTDLGVPLEQAKVSVVDDNQSAAYTDRDGRFTIACASPCVLLIEHPRFIEHVTQGIDVATADLEIKLDPKQAVYEEIVVSATRGGDGDAFAPVSIASTVIKVDDKAAPPVTLTEMVESVAGVAENGQGGIFRVFSIRGISGQRVLSLISGARITSERRAGVSTSFLDPLLIGSVDVLRGPASTYYGSGALGGVVQVFPRQSENSWAELGYDSAGDGSVVAAGWGDGEWSVAVAHRQRDNAETPDGDELFTQFTQTSAALSRDWRRGNTQYQILAVPSFGEDIGKDSQRFPSRPTIYPEENHLLLRFAAEHDSGWKLEAWAHPHDLTTETLRPSERINTVENETFDFGASWQQSWRRGDLSGLVGVDYFGRRDVNASERELRFADQSVSVTDTLADAQEDEIAAFATARWTWGPVGMQAGTRYTVQQQDNASTDFDVDSDGALTGFVGAVMPLGKGFELAGNLGTGLRFPNLSERFFTGTTGRGDIISNPNLDPERSFNSDLSLRWYGEKTFFSFGVFRQDIDDYIERIELDDGSLTFVNLRSGTIDGIEIEGFTELNDLWRLSWNGHLLDGEDDDGVPLSDVPPDRLQVSLHYSSGPWNGKVDFQYRAEKDDPGSGEMAIPDANLVSASVRWSFTDELAVSLTGSNLLDESYFPTADDLATLAPGRAFGLGLSWSR
ncbi:MAG: TonB-dependent receptor [Acidobacteriota bacterium]